MIQQSNAQVFANTYTINANGPNTTCPGQFVPGTGILLCNYRYGVDPAPVIPPAGPNLAAGLLDASWIPPTAIRTLSRLTSASSTPSPTTAL